MFKTTDLTLELLIAGVLVLISVSMLILSLILPPDWFANLSQFPKDPNFDKIEKLIAPFLAVSLPLVIAVSYAVGLVSESVAREALEYGWHNAVKRESLTRYFKANRDVLSKSPILKKYANQPALGQELVIRDADVLIGEMRFYVMMKDDRLYKEVELHLNQLRIIRVLLFVLLIGALAMSIALWRGLFSDRTLGWSLLIFTTLLLIATARAIHARFHRYARAVERSYKALIADEIKSEEKQKVHEQESWLQSLSE